MRCEQHRFPHLHFVVDQEFWDTLKALPQPPLPARPRHSFLYDHTALTGAPVYIDECPYQDCQHEARRLKVVRREGATRLQ